MTVYELPALGTVVLIQGGMVLLAIGVLAQHIVRRIRRK